MYLSLYYHSENRNRYLLTLVLKELYFQRKLLLLAKSYSKYFLKIDSQNFVPL